MDSTLRFRQLGRSDELEALQAHEQLLADDFPFLLDLQDGEPWSRYVDRLQELSRGVNVPEGRVPATFLVAEAGGRIVGRVSIRHELNEFLATIGGHIGYCVLPAYRRRGYATQLLRHGLLVANAAGVDPALVTCDVDNVGSARAILACGGVFEDIVTTTDGSAYKCRYWIATS
jgi:predicted acetyltransferase